MTYKIVRFFRDADNEVIVRGLTLEQAQTHCQDRESSSKTATGDAAKVRTLRFGPWFDGYQEE